MISGSEEYHSKMRGEITRFIAKDGKEKLQWYFDILKETCLSYLMRTLMDENGSWGTEVEILAASAILQVNIYVASEAVAKPALDLWWCISFSRWCAGLSHSTSSMVKLFPKT